MIDESVLSLKINLFGKFPPSPDMVFFVCPLLQGNIPIPYPFYAGIFEG